MIIYNEKILKKLFIVSWLIYFTSYIGRLNYAASMLVIGSQEGYSPSELGLVITSLFISYGIGQLLSGILGDKLSPIKLITLGLGVCSVCNLAMGFVQGIYLLVGVWFVNGLGLAFIWPPMMKIFSRHMPADYLKKCCFNIQSSVALGTFFTYILCSFIIVKYDWQWVFYSASILLIVAAVGAYVAYSQIEKYACQLNQNDKHIEELKTIQINEDKEYSQTTRTFGWQLLVQSGFVIILGAILVMGFLKDGIMTWVPQYLTDTFKLNEYFSIFLSAGLPIINLTGIYTGKFIYQKTNEDDLKTTITLYIISVLSLVGLVVWGEQNMYVSLLMFAIVTSCMLGINTILVSIVPTYFEKYGKTATVAGITNCVTYIGSALCGYGLGLIVQNYGWEVTRLILVGIGILAIVLCVIAFSGWKRFKSGSLEGYVKQITGVLDEA